MTDFLPYNSSTHSTWKLEDDLNNLLGHGLEKTASYIIRKNGSYYEAIKGGTSTGAGTIVYGGSGNVGSVSGTDAAAVINKVLLIMPNYSTIVCKDEILLTAPLTFNGATMANAVGNNVLQFTFIFDALKVATDINILNLSNLFRPFTVIGKKLANNCNNSTAKLINIVGQCELGNIDVGLLEGDWYHGHVTGIYMSSDSVAHDIGFMNIKIGWWYSVGIGLQIDVVTDGYSCCNEIDFGFFENQITQGIIFNSSSTNGIFNNVFKGTGGSSPALFNPDAIVDPAVIKFTVAANGVIAANEFMNFNIFDQTLDIYTSTITLGVIEGTKFIGGMPCPHLESLWNPDTGDAITFRDCFNPATGIVESTTLNGWTDTNAGFVWYNNSYYTSSGFGTVTGAVNTVTVPYALGGTALGGPATHIQVTFIDNIGMGDWVVYDKGAASFKIYFENQPGASNWRFYWTAIYQPNITTP